MHKYFLFKHSNGFILKSFCQVKNLSQSNSLKIAEYLFVLFYTHRPEVGPV